MAIAEPFAALIKSTMAKHACVIAAANIRLER
jgi:hypothetical protein